MKYDTPLLRATLLRRYKRFLADVLLNGEQITVHCANTGSMKNCVVEGAPCWLWDSRNAKRKYRYTWELATTTSGHCAGINTMRANALVEECLRLRKIAPLERYTFFKREVMYGKKSRIDFFLSDAHSRCYVEVKSVTLGVGDGVGLFPDAKSVRATRHLRDLISISQGGDRAVLLFCILHSGIEKVSPADDIDPDYGAALRDAAESGVELLAYRSRFNAEEMLIDAPIPVVL